MLTRETLVAIYSPTMLAAFVSHGRAWWNAGILHANLETIGLHGDPNVQPSLGTLLEPAEYGLPAVYISPDGLVTAVGKVVDPSAQDPNELHGAQFRIA